MEVILTSIAFLPHDVSLATTFSIYLAIYRVYPKLRDYIAERRLCAYPALELYSDSSIVFTKECVVSGMLCLLRT